MKRWLVLSLSITLMLIAGAAAAAGMPLFPVFLAKWNILAALSASPWLLGGTLLLLLPAQVREDQGRCDLQQPRHLGAVHPRRLRDALLELLMLPAQQVLEQAAGVCLLRVL